MEVAEQGAGGASPSRLPLGTLALELRAASNGPVQRPLFCHRYEITEHRDRLDHMMSASGSDAFISVLDAAGAPPDLVRTARNRLAGTAIFAEACTSLHRELSDEEFGYSNKLNEIGLGDDGAKVLAWFLARNSSCTKLRRVDGAACAWRVCPTRCGRPQPRRQFHLGSGGIGAGGRATGQLGPAGAVVRGLVVRAGEWRGACVDPLRPLTASIPTASRMRAHRRWATRCGPTRACSSCSAWVCGRGSGAVRDTCV